MLKTTKIHNCLDYRKITEKTVNKFSIFHNNIRSLQKNFENFQVLMQQISNSFDCIVLTETFILYDTELYNFNGYDLIYSDGQFNRNDGIVIYIKKHVLI